MAGPRGATDSATTPQKAKRPRRPRGSIDVEDIIDGAFALAEEVSLSKLSVPMLAKHLDVAITSIYWHYRKKEDLLDAMADRAAKEYHFSMPFIGVDDWQEALRKHFLAMRTLFREKPVLCDLILMRTGELDADTMQQSLKNLETAVGTLVDAGFTAEEALDLYLTLSLHCRGIAVLEHLDTAGSTRKISHIPSAEHTPLLHDLAIGGLLSQSMIATSFAATVDAIIAQAEQKLLAKKG